MVQSMAVTIRVRMEIICSKPFLSTVVIFLFIKEFCKCRYTNLKYLGQTKKYAASQDISRIYFPCGEIVGQTNINTCRVSELIPETAEYKYISLYKILSKFVVKLFK